MLYDILSIYSLRVWFVEFPDITVRHNFLRKIFHTKGLIHGDTLKPDCIVEVPRTQIVFYIISNIAVMSCYINIIMNALIKSLI